MIKNQARTISINNQWKEHGKACKIEQGTPELVPVKFGETQKPWTTVSGTDNGISLGGLYYA